VVPGNSRFLYQPAKTETLRANPENAYVAPNRDSVNRDWKFNWQNPTADLARLDNAEGQNGFLVLGERVQPNQETLLGLQLRTTRDEDRDLSKKELPGLKVFDVEFGSVAHEMGLMRGDLIVNVNGTNVDSGGASEAARILSGVLALGKGKLVTIDAVRKVGSQYLYIQVKGTLGEPKATLVPADAVIEK
jgi:predicted metalloprotease with PDZ domain